MTTSLSIANVTGVEVIVIALTLCHPAIDGGIIVLRVSLDSKDGLSVLSTLQVVGKDTLFGMFLSSFGGHWVPDKRNFRRICDWHNVCSCKVHLVQYVSDVIITDLSDCEM